MLAELVRAARPATTPIVRAPRGAPLPWATFATETWGENWEAGDWVTDEDALGLEVVSESLEILVALVVQMPLQSWADGRLSKPTPPILRNPAPGPTRTLSLWVTEALRGLALRGNYLAVLGDNSWTGWPDVMYPVPWGQWTAAADPATGLPVYMVAGRGYPGRDVFHVARNVETGELVGRGLIDTHRQLLASSVAAERWAANYYKTGAVPPAWIEHADPDLTPGQAADLKAIWNRVVRLREAIITPAGTKVTALSSDAEKAQLADTRRANNAKLAIACGIPGALLGLEGPSLTYRNITDVFQQYVTTTVMGYLEPVEQQFTEFCLPRGTEARFGTAAVLRPDLPSRLTMAVTGYQAGIMTLDEARAFVDLPPLPAGDHAVEPGPPALAAVS